eukprot:COSAG02_NODE_4672_length_5107_cov_5.286142_2_plen_99_part_00
MCRNEQNKDAPIPDAASALAVLQGTFVENTHDHNVEQLMRDSLFLVSKDGTGTVVGFTTIVQESEKATITAFCVIRSQRLDIAFSFMRIISGNSCGNC